MPWIRSVGQESRKKPWEKINVAPLSTVNAWNAFKKLNILSFQV